VPGCLSVVQIRSKRERERERGTARQREEKKERRPSRPMRSSHRHALKTFFFLICSSGWSGEAYKRSFSAPSSLLFLRFFSNSSLLTSPPFFFTLFFPTSARSPSLLLIPSHSVCFTRPIPHLTNEKKNAFTTTMSESAASQRLAFVQNHLQVAACANKEEPRKKT